MKSNLAVSRIASEFDIQSDLYQRLKEHGLCVRGECRVVHAGKKLRLDIACFSDGRLTAAIEVKLKRRKAWRSEWLKGQQAMAYERLPIPVLMVCGEAESSLLTADIAAASESLGGGILWVESWSQLGVVNQ